MATLYTPNLGNFTPIPSLPPMAGFSIPVRSGLTSARLLGNGLEVAKFEFATGNYTEGVHGPITEQSGSLLFGDGAYIDSGVAETLAMTIVIACKESVANSVAFVGNYAGGSNVGVSMYTNASSTVMSANVGRVEGGGSSSVGSDTAAWGCYALQVPATGAHTLRNLTAGNANSSVATGDRVLNGGGNIRIGGAVSAFPKGGAEINSVLLYNRALTLTEINKLAVWMREYAASCGIAV